MNILYLHGFGSSGLSNTVEYLKKALPDYYNIDAPDIPVDPAEALPYLKELCEKEHFSIIIGTSMGAMYAQQLPADFVRICVNPALHLSQLTDILKPGMFDFFQPRKDGQTQFAITEVIIQHFREMEEHQFDNWKANAPENLLCMGLFGTEDTTVNCREEFARHYPNVQSFEGGHRMNQKVLKNVVVPIVKRLEEYRREAGLLGQLENCARFCPEDRDTCLFCQNYGGHTLCGDKPLHFMKRYFIEKEWQRLLQEGLISQPEEKEPAIHVGDKVYGFSANYRKLYKGSITEIVSYTDKNHYEANISMRPFYGLPVKTRIVMDGLFDTPRVSLGIKSLQFAKSKTAEQPVEMQIEELSAHSNIAPLVFLDKASANETAQEYLKGQIELINKAINDVARELTEREEDQ
jgi:predicted esterase YcpF (UPF0227 family)